MAKSVCSEALTKRALTIVGFCLVATVISTAAMYGSNAWQANAVQYDNHNDSYHQHCTDSYPCLHQVCGDHLCKPGQMITNPKQ